VKLCIKLMTTPSKLIQKSSNNSKWGVTSHDNLPPNSNSVTKICPLDPLLW
jgi:hypothetical protein